MPLTRPLVLYAPSRLSSEVIGKPRDTLKLAVPAVLYYTQNICLQLSAANLPAAIFQISYQVRHVYPYGCVYN